MSEIHVDKNLNELNLFKNEILGQIRELDKKLNAKIDLNQIKLNEDFKSYEKKISSLIENDKDMVIKLVTQKLKLEKISELENFKNKVDDMIITHEIRIKNILDDISRIKLRYDKIVSDNLYVPGFIGNACQFKNLSEYLSYNISEVSKLKIEKDQIKKEMKDIKVRFEGLMKNMINLNDTSVKLCKNYTDSKQKEFEIMIENNKKELEQKNLEMRSIMNDFQKKAEENEKKFTEEFNKLVDMKQEFINIIDDKFLEVKQFNDELNKRVINNNLDIDIQKKKIEKINEQIKELFQSSKDISFQVRNYYCANNKIMNFKEKLEKLNFNLNDSEKSKLIQIKNEINTINNSINNSNSPNKKIGNKKNLTKSAFHYKSNTEEMLPIKNNIAKSIIKDKNYFNKIGINHKTETSESESSISIKNFNEEENNNEINKKLNISISKKNNIHENNNTLPSIIKKYKDENILDENKKINSSSNDINKSIIKEKDNNNNNELKIKIKKSNLGNILNNDYENNKLKINHKKEIMNKGEYEIEQDKQACKLVTLTLPDPQKETFITKRNKIRKKKFKNDIMNSLINSYRAKLFPKAHSPDEQNEINNELLDIPKKISQAFGRTTYTFYFRKDQLHSLINNNNNKNINNFGSSNSKKRIKAYNQ